MMRYLYKMLIAMGTVTLLSAPVAASPAVPLQPTHFIGRYEFDWAGIRLGGITLEIDDKADSYALHLLVISQGIVNLFTHHISNTEAAGTRSGNTYHPRHYESHYWTKKKPRHIRLAFNAEGAVTETLNEPPEDRKERPEIPGKITKGSYDPLSGIMAIRAGVLLPHAFDAKRLYEVRAEDKGPLMLTIMGRPRLSHAYSLSRKPIAGLTAKENAEYAKGEPKLSFFFSEDAKRIPLFLSVPVYLGNVNGTLVQECATWEECKAK